MDPTLATDSPDLISATASIFGLSPLEAALFASLAYNTVPWIAAKVPYPAPTSRWMPARRLLDVLAANVGHARNAGPALSNSFTR